MAFHALQVLPDVYHIQDCMGVCMTLLVGKDRALLVDTGYGLENVLEMTASITALPVTVLLTHAHHDHALGALKVPLRLQRAIRSGGGNFHIVVFHPLHQRQYSPVKSLQVVQRDALRPINIKAQEMAGRLLYELHIDQLNLHLLCDLLCNLLGFPDRHRMPRH